MSSIRYQSFTNDENASSRLQNINRMKNSSSQAQTSAPKIRSAFGELSNTISKKVGLSDRSNAQTPFKSNLKDKVRVASSAKSHKSAKSEKKSQVNARSAVEMFNTDAYGDIESMPLNPNEEQDETYEEFVWPREDRLSMTDLNYLCCWIPSNKPKAADLTRINSSEETIHENFIDSPLFVANNSPSDIQPDQDMYDSSEVAPVLFDDLEDD